MPRPLSSYMLSVSIVLRILKVGRLCERANTPPAIVKSGSHRHRSGSTLSPPPQGPPPCRSPPSRCPFSAYSALKHLHGHIRRLVSIRDHDGHVNGSGIAEGVRGRDCHHVGGPSLEVQFRRGLHCDLSTLIHVLRTRNVVAYTEQGRIGAAQRVNQRVRVGVWVQWQ